MSDVNLLLATHYLPHVRVLVSESYAEFIPASSMAGHFGRLHLFMWKMALTDESYDLVGLRNALTRAGYAVSEEMLQAIDDRISNRLFTLIDEYGAHMAGELRTAVAITAAALQFSAPIPVAA